MTTEPPEMAEATAADDIEPPLGWERCPSGWVREDALLLEASIRWKGGERRDLTAWPAAGWNVGVERGAPDGDGLDRTYPALGDGVWLDETEDGRPARAFDAMARCNVLWPYCPDIAAKIGPRVKRPLERALERLRHPRDGTGQGSL